MALKENEMKKYLSMFMILTMVLQAAPIALAGTGPVVTNQFGSKGGSLLDVMTPIANTGQTSANQNFFTGKVGYQTPVQNSKNTKKQTYTNNNNQGNTFYMTATKGPLTNLGQAYYINGIQDTRGMLSDPKFVNYLKNTQSGQNQSGQNQGYQQNNSYQQNNGNMSEADKQREQRRWEMTFGANQANRNEDRKYALLERQMAREDQMYQRQVAQQNAQMNAQVKQQNMDRIMGMTMMTFGLFAQYKTQRNAQKAVQHEQDANRAYYQQKDKAYYDHLRDQNRTKYETQRNEQQNRQNEINAQRAFEQHERDAQRTFEQQERDAQRAFEQQERDAQRAFEQDEIAAQRAFELKQKKVEYDFLKIQEKYKYQIQKQNQSSQQRAAAKKAFENKKAAYEKRKRADQKSLALKKKKIQSNFHRKQKDRQNRHQTQVRIRAQKRAQAQKRARP